MSTRKHVKFPNSRSRALNAQAKAREAKQNQHNRPWGEIVSYRRK